MQGIELVGLREPFLQPVPLGDGSLHQAGRSVAVVFKQLDMAPVVGQVQPAVQRGRLALPSLANVRRGSLGNVHAIQQIPVQNRISGRERQPLDFGRSCLKALNLFGREFPVRRLVPIGAAIVERMVGEANALHAALPIRTRIKLMSPHYSPASPPPCPPSPPSP